MRKSKIQSLPVFQQSKYKMVSEFKANLFFCRNVVFDLDNFINQVCIRFENSRDYDAPMVLIEWIDQLHSSPSVNVIEYMPRLLNKFLAVIEA